LSEVLDTHGVNMNTSLTTFDGYPRDDIDVAQIRTVRARIIPLRNDYKALMDKIEVGLHEHFASTAASQAQSTIIPRTSASATSDTASGLSAADVSEVPFATVNSVAPGSPADDAGLQAGDGIRRFGQVNWLNHEKLSKVAETVQRNEERAIEVKVLRKHAATRSSEEMSLTLTPRKDWGGRGMLGCHLVPA